MARPCDFLMILVLMSYWSTCSLGCVLNTTDETLFKLLVPKKQSSPRFSLEDRDDFLCPLQEMDAQQIQKPQVIQVLQELTEQSLLLFTSDESYAAWETTLLEKFCEAIDKQLKKLQACPVQQVGVQEHPQSQEHPVKKYFMRITEYLREKKHSPSAWEVVKVEIRRAWSFSDNLIKELNKKEE
ncbi:hypothetical protein U0070_007531 [Myodes glareolus]|uniref:Uncharacterized protein n=1 Tax=Myodes glareolus TaxID=447135 RepID=A0AAW0J0C2_MYOGA